MKKDYLLLGIRMRKQISTFVMLLGILPLKAQIDPQAGYIITNENDTLRGIIDYRTDAKNSRSCLFVADGETEYKEYLPNEIKCYRLLCRFLSAFVGTFFCLPPLYFDYEYC